VASQSPQKRKTKRPSECRKGGGEQATEKNLLSLLFAVFASQVRREAEPEEADKGDSQKKHHVPSHSSASKKKPPRSFRACSFFPSQPRP